MVTVAVTVKKEGWSDRPTYRWLYVFNNDPSSPHSVGWPGAIACPITLWEVLNFKSLHERYLLAAVDGMPIYGEGVIRPNPTRVTC